MKNQINITSQLGALVAFINTTANDIKLLMFASVGGLLPLQGNYQCSGKTMYHS